MATYALTVSTSAIGLGVLSGARVFVERLKTTVSDLYGGQGLTKNSAATNQSGIAVFYLQPDDNTVYHKMTVFDLSGIPVYSANFSMSPSAVNFHELPAQDIITASATQAIAASVTATAQAVISTDQAVIATTKAIESAASAASFRVNSATYAAIPTLTASCFVFVSADETNGNQPTVYFFDGTNLNWLPSVGV